MINNILSLNISQEIDRFSPKFSLFFLSIPPPSSFKYSKVIKAVWNGEQGFGCTPVFLSSVNPFFSHPFVFSVTFPLVSEVEVLLLLSRIKPSPLVLILFHLSLLNYLPSIFLFLLCVFKLSFFCLSHQKSEPTKTSPQFNIFPQPCSYYLPFFQPFTLLLNLRLIYTYLLPSPFQYFLQPDGFFCHHPVKLLFDVPSNLFMTLLKPYWCLKQSARGCHIVHSSQLDCYLLAVLPCFAVFFS